MRTRTPRCCEARDRVEVLARLRVANVRGEERDVRRARGLVLTRDGDVARAVAGAAYRALHAERRRVAPGFRRRGARDAHQRRDVLRLDAEREPAIACTAYAGERTRVAAAHP